MKKERVCNTLYGTVKDAETIELLGGEFPLKSEFEPGTEIKVEVPFDAIDLMDNLDDGVLDGEVHFILYMGNHYHLTIKTDDGDSLWVDTNDIWDKGDLVGIQFKADKGIKISKKDEQAQ
jgi:spermidine/putrescine transport system ATP-binding protein